MVEVEDIVWQRQLNTLRHLLLRNLHKEMGEALVTEIDFRPMPRRLAPQRAETARPAGIEGIQDPVLGAAVPAIEEEGNGVKITEQEVRRVADLANLALRDDEVARMAQDLDGILTHIDKLNELDTTQCRADGAGFVRCRKKPRRCARIEERPPLTNAEAVGNAPLSGGGYFKVPKVIER